MVIRIRALEREFPIRVPPETVAYSVHNDPISGGASVRLYLKRSGESFRKTLQRAQVLSQDTPVEEFTSNGQPILLLEFGVDPEAEDIYEFGIAATDQPGDPLTIKVKDSRALMALVGGLHPDAETASMLKSQGVGKLLSAPSLANPIEERE